MIINIRYLAVVLVYAFTSSIVYAQSSKAAEKNFVILNLEETPIFMDIGSISSSELDQNEIENLNASVSEFISNYNKDLTIKVNTMVFKNSNHKTMWINSHKLDDAESYFRQFMPAINSKNEKLVWVNCIHKSKMKTIPKNLLITADGIPNQSFSFWTNLTTGRLLRK